MKCFSPLRSLLFLLLTPIVPALAQSSSIPAPQPPDFNAPGLRLDSIVRYLSSGITPADTGEGNRAARIAQFTRVWAGRVVVNDSSGDNMFARYISYSRRAAATARSAGICATGSYSGRWKNIGPDSLPSTWAG